MARVGLDREAVPGKMDGVDSVDGVDDVSCPPFRDPVFRSRGCSQYRTVKWTGTLLTLFAAHEH